MHNNLTRRLRRLLFSNWYKDMGGPADHILVAGGGRSGTTWLATLLAHLYDYRVIFEPFYNLHLQREGQADFFHQRYIPTSQLAKYKADIQTVLAGQYGGYAVNSNYHYKYHGRVIKAICANSFLPVIRELYPTLPIIFVVRQPAAVATSRLLKKQWSTPWGPHAHLFKAQSQFMHDYVPMGWLEPRDEFDDHLISYCLENLIPAQLERTSGSFLKVHYEAVVREPSPALNQIMDYIDNIGQLKPRAGKLETIDAVLAQPVMARQQTGSSQSTSVTQKQITDERRERVREVVDHFQLRDFFNE